MTRALRATTKAGIEVQRVEIDRDGKIVVIVGKPDDVSGDTKEIEL